MRDSTPLDQRPALFARLRVGGGYDRFTRWTELPMLALSLAFPGALVVPVLDQRLFSGRGARVRRD